MHRYQKALQLEVHNEMDSHSTIGMLSTRCPHISGDCIATTPHCSAAAGLLPFLAHINSLCSVLQ